CRWRNRTGERLISGKRGVLKARVARAPRSRRFLARIMSTNVQVPVRTVASVNPASGEVLRELACAGEEEVHAAVVRSRAFQAQGCDVGPRKRVGLLREFQRVLCEKQSDVAGL